MASILGRRSAGVLLHPTSLPGRFGVGDIGPTAYDFIDQLARAKQGWWQILPVGPTGFGDSPYQSFSSFAGNPVLISPDLLRLDGLLTDADLRNQGFDEAQVDYPNVIAFKTGLLRTAYERFRGGESGMESEFEQFCHDQSDWLDDYAFFMTVFEARKGEPWQEWPRELLRRDSGPKFHDFFREELGDELGFHQFGQFLFAKQWTALRDHARKKGIKIIGDLPIFTALVSADVWANPKLFLLDSAMRPREVAGVPPDYFAASGQLWGNPLYDWDAHKEEDYDWWAARLRSVFERVDVVRLDHFRGFAAAYQVPAGRPDATIGAWVPGPGRDLFLALERHLGHVPILAEDLGVITPDVYTLRDEFRLPGMKVMQFSLGGPDNLHLPQNFETTNCVAYTGTHDNDTTNGWYRTLSDHERHELEQHAGPIRDAARDVTRWAFASVAKLAVVPMQDLLGLGTESRMNYPGIPSNNWRWRMRPGAFHDGVVERLAEMTVLANRG